MCGRVTTFTAEFSATDQGTALPQQLAWLASGREVPHARRSSRGADSTSGALFKCYLATKAFSN